MDASTKRLLIQADGGGATGSRQWAWKVALQELANECGLIITVMHYPPGASTWTLIEHRMFSLISANGAGEPLVSHEVMLKFIRRTRSETGFHCKARLDIMPYAKVVKITAEQRAGVRLRRRPVLPQWNYTIWPRAISPRN